MLKCRPIYRNIKRIDTNVKVYNYTQVCSGVYTELLKYIIIHNVKVYIQKY